MIESAPPATFAMNMAPTRCCLTVYAKREHRIRQCGAKVTHVINVRGDQLFAICQRHKGRLNRAFLGWAE